MKYSGWWRCRIKGRTKVYPWLYFKVESNNKREYRRAARKSAQLILNRVDFEFEAIHDPPENLLRVELRISDPETCVQYWCDTALKVPEGALRA